MRIIVLSNLVPPALTGKPRYSKRDGPLSSMPAGLYRTPSRGRTYSVASVKLTVTTDAANFRESF